MNEIRTALGREAALVAEQMCAGATLVSKTNYARQGRYLQLFFLLSIAFERASKLIIVLDHMTGTGGKPNEKEYRKYQHNLDKLLVKVEEISSKFSIEDYRRMPKTQIHNDMITILSDFACNVTRYYNLDVVAQGNNNKNGEPISQWYQKVILPLFEKHVGQRKKERILNNALLVSRMMDGHAVVSHTDEAGETMNTMIEASFQTGLLEAVAPYTRLYVLQICRFLGAVLSEYGYIGMKRQVKDIPYMSDFFRVFHNKDILFKNRKTWEIV